MAKFSDWARGRSEAALSALAASTDAVVSPRGVHAEGSHRKRRRINDRARFSGVLITCVSVFLLLALLDILARLQLNLSPLYLTVVSIAAWSSGRKAGLSFAAAAALALWIRHLVDPAATPGTSWHPLFHLGIFVVAAMAVASVRLRFDKSERRARERAASLEHEISDRCQTEEQLRKAMQQFRQMAENISDAFWMRDAREARMAYVSPAYEVIWGRTCRELYQFPQRWLEAIHPEDRERVAESMYTRQAAGEYSQEYRIVRPDGALRWIRDRAFPIRDSAGTVVRIVGIAEDITERRRLEREILEISDREQARMGQDLHDGLCQKLVSLAFDHNSLEQQLSLRERPEAEAVRVIGAVLDDAITEARAMARGLFPVQLETNGLALALEQLASGVSSRARVACRFQCETPVSITDNATATHLYRIAQEAVNNSVKHGNPRSIVIGLAMFNDVIELTVTDDGDGISGTAPREGGGMGMHIMNYRARTIGGILGIGNGPERGTIVSCSVRQQSA